MLYCSEEGAEEFSPGFQPWEIVPPLRSALKGRQIECVNSTHLTNSDLSPLQGESPYLIVPRVEALG